MITDKYKYVSMDAVKEILRQVELDRERDVIFLPYVVEIPKWIPVTERLPEEDGRYLISHEDHGVIVDKWLDGEWLNYSLVEAWMPLPEPWCKDVIE